MIYKWRHKFEAFGEAGLEAHAQRESPEFHRLADENRRLKTLLVDKDLEILMLREVLKKKGVPSRK